MLVTTKSIILLSIILLLSIVMASLFISSSAYGDYFEQVESKYNETLWKLGNNIQEGDMYEYKICSDKTIYQVIHPYHCYNVSLEFVTILESYKGMVWVVQGNFTTLEINRSMIFLINPDTFEVNTDLLNVNLGKSIQNTIFSLSQYSKKSLSFGTIWGMIPSYFTNDIPLEIKRQEIIFTQIGEIDSVILGYDIIEESNYYISKNIPFPVKAEIFSPNIIFPEPIEEYWYELESYSNKHEQIDNEHEDIEHSVPVPIFEVRPN